MKELSKGEEMNPIIQGLGNARYRELLSRAREEQIVIDPSIQQDVEFQTRSASYFVRFVSWLQARTNRSDKEKREFQPFRRVL